MFGNPNSCWSQLPWERILRDNPKTSPLIQWPAFRQMLARQLDCKEIYAAIKWQEPNTLQYTLTNSATSWLSFKPSDSNSLTNGATAELRRCDWIALSLPGETNWPPFNPFLPAPQRDERVKMLKDWLLTPPVKNR
jgi:hypothetical protein